jgi:hypothetical protein
MSSTNYSSRFLIIANISWPVIVLHVCSLLGWLIVSYDTHSMFRTEMHAHARRAAGKLVAHAPKLLRDRHALKFRYHTSYGALVQREVRWLGMTPAECAAQEAEQLRQQTERRVRREAAMWAVR